jgi:hypothetical protein
MCEEEKLARDIYITLGTQYPGTKVLGNIDDSEERRGESRKRDLLHRLAGEFRVEYKVQAVRSGGPQRSRYLSSIPPHLLAAFGRLYFVPQPANVAGPSAARSCRRLSRIVFWVYALC